MFNLENVFGKKAKKGNDDEGRDCGIYQNESGSPPQL